MNNKISLGIFVKEDAEALKEALLAQGIISEINPSKYIQENDMKYMPIYLGKYTPHPELEGLERASILEILVQDVDLDKSKGIQQDLEINSFEEYVSTVKNKLNLNQNTVDTVEDILKAFQLTGGGMGVNNSSNSINTAYADPTDIAFINFIFNQKTKDYFKQGLGKKLFIGFILEIIISIFLLIDPLGLLPINFPTGFILLVLLWSGLMVMSFPYRERFGSKVTNIYVWMVNIFVLLAIVFYLINK